MVAYCTGIYLSYIDYMQDSRVFACLSTISLYSRQHSVQVRDCRFPLVLVFDALRLRHEASPVWNLVQAVANQVVTY